MININISAIQTQIDDNTMTPHQNSSDQEVAPGGTLWQLKLLRVII